VHAGEEDHACTAWLDNIKTWTGLTMEESIRMAEVGDKWRKYVHGVDGYVTTNAYNGEPKPYLRAGDAAQ